MSKRSSIEEKVLTFFRDAPLAVAESLLRLAEAEVKCRLAVRPGKRKSTLPAGTLVLSKSKEAS